MKNKTLNLSKDFPPTTTEEWLKIVTKDLKGADFNKKLVWKTKEGINVQPFYRAKDIEKLQTTNFQPNAFPYLRGTKTNNDWYIRQNINAKNPKEANKKALDILQKGITSIGFHLNKHKLSAEYLEELLKDIDPRAIELNFTVCIQRITELPTLLIEHFKKHDYFDNPQSLVGTINFDPFNKILTKGKKLSKKFISDKIKALITNSLELPSYRVVNTSAVELNNAGATATQELGYALAWASDYLNLMLELGLEHKVVTQKMFFTFGVSSNYFMEIAKFRAGRMLWALIVNAYDTKKGLGDECKMKIHAETSQFNKTVFDSYVNLLRTQTEAMSATIAGVDTLTVLPFDIPYKDSDNFSERIARNQQLLLKEECNFDKLIDPSAGSYYIENLTQNVAEKSWELFLEIEENGGFFNAIQQGVVQKEIENVAKERLQSISQGREVLLGTNKFPNFTEKALSKIEKEDAIHHCETCGHNQPTEKEATTILRAKRGAKEFEYIRLATEKAQKRPKVFMLTIGNLAMRLARSQFSSNFFAIAGYEIKDNLGFDTIKEGVEKALKEKADIVVLCSSDDAYEELAPEAYQLLEKKAILVVAGAPQCMEKLKSKGIHHFINIRSNILETLQFFNEQLLQS